MSIRSILIFFSVLSFLAILSCERDNDFMGGTPMISTSIDTLTFDTVFTTIGSATRSFKIYNDESSDIEVSISTDLGSNSKFRLNVDGISGPSVENVPIRSGDSLYVFADVTVDPDQPLSISPFIIEESLTVKSGDSEKKVQLNAWGQNANYVPGTKRKGIVSLLSCDMQSVTWDDPKPYVVYGILIIDSCELVLPEGTDIFVHGGIVRDDDIIYNDGLIAVLQNGSINADGTALDPVTIQGDRLEESFDDLAGQWSGIRFTAGSRDNILEHVQLKNSIVGVRVDSAASLTLNSTEIFNTTSAGLIGVRADINAVNTAIYNNGQNCALLTYGGNYDFKHCTFASYGNQSSALRLDNFRCTDPPLCQEQVFVNRAVGNFVNCIFTGNEDDEISLADWTDGAEPDLFQYSLENCIVTVDELIAPERFPNFFDNCQNCLTTDFGDTLFLDQNMDIYTLDTMSMAIDKGKFLNELQEDILDNLRDGMPDIGAWEFFE